MKIRSGFVSNSSSSSFILIANTQDEEYLKGLKKNHKGWPMVVNKDFGTAKFGWDYDQHTDVGSKIIFSYIQYYYVKEKHPEWLVMLEKVIKDNLGVIDIDWNWLDAAIERYDAYIDHQSASNEGQNTDMFNGEDYLARFLFNPRSLIETDNDNH